MVRLQIAVLEVEHIPDDADIMVDDCLYEIFFNIDHVIRADEGDNFDDVDDLDEDEEGNYGNAKHGEDHVMEDAQLSDSNKSASEDSHMTTSKGTQLSDLVEANVDGDMVLAADF